MTVRGLLALVVLCLLWLAPAFAAAQSGSAELEAQIAQARAAYDMQRQGLEAERARFDAYLLEVDALKEQQADAGAMASNEAVRDALREAREMALELHARGETLRSLSDQIRRLESDLFAALDERQLRLEAALVDAAPGERAPLIEQLAALSETRARYLEPLAPLPQVELDEILLGLEEETTPEELQATADELADHERRLEEHLAELERHIRQFELRERDRAFRSEASLFEEGQNTGRREERASTDTSGEGGSRIDGSNDSATGGTQGETNEPPQSGGSDQEVPTGDNGNEGEPATPGDGDPLDGAAEPGSLDGDSGFNGEGGRGDDESPTTGGGGVTNPDEFNTGGGSVPDPGFEPPPTPPSLIGVTTSVQDPTQLIWIGGDEGRPSDAERGTRSRLERLRQEREQTEDTLDEVREERQRLLDRVQRLELEEGF